MASLVGGEPIKGAIAVRLPRTRRDRPGALLLVRDSLPDSVRPAQTPESCLGVKGSPVQIRPSRPLHCRSEATLLSRQGGLKIFDRTLPAGFGGILRHVTFVKSGERHIMAEWQ